MQGKDLYSEIASVSFHRAYEDCLEFYLDENGNKTDKTNKEGKKYRSQAKSILLGVLYGRGTASIAEQLGCTTEEAQAIKDSVFQGFPAIKKFEEDSLAMARELGYVTTVCGRKRRLPDLQLDSYEFAWKKGFSNPYEDPLDFDDVYGNYVPDSICDYFWDRLMNARYKKDIKKIFEDADKQGIEIIDNRTKISNATRQCVNARIQGSAADLTKMAMIELYKSQRLKDLNFSMLIPVHDEIIAECPEENAKECAKLLAQTMSKAAEQILEMPIKCDVVCSKCWYGDEIEL
jgi:DNA polymerase I-like protein with 3'-5' exonuclease and polymerase domains